MALNKPESIASELEARRESLKQIKADLLARIAALWANRENEPVGRSDFKLIVKPGNKAVVTSYAIFPFSAVEHFFEEEAEKLLQGIGRQYPGRTLIMEFLVYPYENGGRKLRPDAAFYPAVSAPAQEVSQKRAAVNNRVKQVIAPLRVEIPVKDALLPAAEVPAVNVSPVVEPPAELPQDLPDDSRQEPPAELPQDPPAALIPASPAAPPANEAPLLPSKKERKSMLEQLKTLIREADIAQPEGAEPDPDFLNSPIDFECAKWNLYPTSQILRRIRKAMAANQINTPRELAARLGTNNPTKAQWQIFITQINSAVGPNWLGEGGSHDLLYWMRKNRLIKPDFRKE